MENPWPGQPNLRETKAYERVREMFLSSVRYYLEICRKTASRTRANLEEVFSRAEREGRRANSIDPLRYRFRPTLAINYLLGRLQNDFPATPHAALARGIGTMIGNRNRGDHVSFLSFNYDMWLERELQREGLWHPRTGYGMPFEKFINLPLAREVDAADKRMRESGFGVSAPVFSPISFQHSFESRVRVLKPHGSLSWYLHKKSGEILLLLEGDEDSLVTANEGRWYVRDLWADMSRGRTYEPFFTPPVPQKLREREEFSEIDKQIDADLIEADTVVVIGWSMPKTDLDWETKIRQVMKNRLKKIQCLIVCNKADSIAEDGEAVARIESVFRPVQPVRIMGSGFESSTEKICDFLEQRKQLDQSMPDSHVLAS